MRQIFSPNHFPHQGKDLCWDCIYTLAKVNKKLILGIMKYIAYVFDVAGTNYANSLKLIIQELTVFKRGK